MTEFVEPDSGKPESAGIVPPLAQALAERGYTDMTPVQNAVLAPELAAADLLVSAQTGSGKTVAFGMAVAPTLLEGQDRFPKADTPLALVVAPTRELAQQVKRELDWLYAKTGAVIVSAVGGMDIRSERRDLQRGAHIVVGTPGRLRDHISRHAFDTTELRAVILDEADEMLDLGFREDLEFILEQTPDTRRTLLFSATVPPMIAKLAKNFQRDAVRVTTQQERDQHGDIDYRVLMHAPRERENAIINVLRYYDAENALVFCNTRAAVNHMVSRFNNRGFSVVALSGELSQDERMRALQSLRDGRARVCIATDVAARGIDLPKLELVIHADLPSNPETLLHRSGRTGRAGRKGISALMVDNRGRNKAERLLRFAKLEATWASPPSADEVNQRDEERMMSDAILTESANETETAFAERLLATFTPEQVATAFLRQHRAGQSAPEDIEIISPDAPKKRKFDDAKGPRERAERPPRDDFDESVWVTLSVGRKQNAEPRWLIPLLCNAGDITKRDIGFIKIQQGETHVQLNAEKADSFAQSIGSNMTLEKNVRVKIQADKPEFEAYSPKPDFKKPHRGKKPFDKTAERTGDKPFKKKRDGDNRPAKKWDGEKASTEKKSKPDWDRKPVGDKPFKKKKPRHAKDGDGSKQPAKPYAKKAKGGYPKGDHSKSEKPKGDKFKGEKPKGDNAGGGKSSGAKAAAKKPVFKKKGKPAKRSD